MKRCKTHVLCVCLLFLAAVPAFGQRITLGADVGQTTDKFGGFSSNNALVWGIDGEAVVLTANEKKGSPSIVAGGEMIIPSDSQNHATEYALYGGPVFKVRDFSIGVDAQIRKIILPPASEGTQVLNRDKMELLEIPVTIKYNFGPGKHAFVQAQGAPEFSPRFRNGSPNPFTLPTPNLDHGYFLRGTAGYTFGVWYAKASYETRYFKFAPNAGNPNGVYNWRTDRIMGGVGFVF